MQRHWTDPRDGETWLVTVTPFGWSGKGGPAEADRAITVAFHRPGTTPIWTRYSTGRPISAATDQDLMDFLDAARQHGRPRRHRADTRSPARARRGG